MSVVVETRRTGNGESVVAGIGLGIGVALAVVRIVGGEGRPPTAWLEDATLAVILLAPLALAVAVRGFEPAVRGGVWTGAGLLTAFLGVLTVMSIGVAFLAIGVLMVVGGVRAWRVGPPRFLVSAAVVLAAGVIAPLGSLFLLPSTPACWERSSVGDAQAWERVPVRGAAMDRAYGSPGVVGFCSSDTVTPTEAGLAVGPWLATVAGFVLWDRRREAA